MESEEAIMENENNSNLESQSNIRNRDLQQSSEDTVENANSYAADKQDYSSILQDSSDQLESPATVEESEASHKVTEECIIDSSSGQRVEIKKSPEAVNASASVLREDDVQDYEDFVGGDETSHHADSQSLVSGSIDCEHVDEGAEDCQQGLGAGSTEETMDVDNNSFDDSKTSFPIDSAEVREHQHKNSDEMQEENPQMVDQDSEHRKDEDVPDISKGLDESADSYQPGFSETLKNVNVLPDPVVNWNAEDFFHDSLNVDNVNKNGSIAQEKWTDNETVHHPVDEGSAAKELPTELRFTADVKGVLSDDSVIESMQDSPQVQADVLETPPQDQVTENHTSDGAVSAMSHLSRSFDVSKAEENGPSPNEASGEVGEADMDVESASLLEVNSSMADSNRMFKDACVTDTFSVSSDVMESNDNNEMVSLDDNLAEMDDNNEASVKIVERNMNTGEPAIEEMLGKTDSEHHVSSLPNVALSVEEAELSDRVSKVTDSVAEGMESSNTVSDVLETNNTVLEFMESSNMVSEVMESSNTTSEVMESSYMKPDVTESSNPTSKVVKSSKTASEVMESGNAVPESEISKTSSVHSSLRPPENTVQLSVHKDSCTQEDASRSPTEVTDNSFKATENVERSEDLSIHDEADVKDDTVSSGDVTEVAESTYDDSQAVNTAVAPSEIAVSNAKNNIVDEGLEVNNEDSLVDRLKEKPENTESLIQDGGSHVQNGSETPQEDHVVSESVETASESSISPTTIDLTESLDNLSEQAASTEHPQTSAKSDDTAVDKSETDSKRQDSVVSKDGNPKDGDISADPVKSTNTISEDIVSEASEIKMQPGHSSVNKPATNTTSRRKSRPTSLKNMKPDLDNSQSEKTVKNDRSFTEEENATPVKNDAVESKPTENGLDTKNSNPPSHQKQLRESTKRNSLASENLDLSKAEAAKSKSSKSKIQTCLVCQKICKCKYNIVRNGDVKHLCDDLCFKHFRKTPNQFLKSTEPEPPKPKPVAPKPSPAAPKPSPAASKPSPAASKPSPAASKPLPAASKPSPAASKPSPAASKPSPAAPKSSSSKSTKRSTRSVADASPPLTNALALYQHEIESRRSNTYKTCTVCQLLNLNTSQPYCNWKGLDFCGESCLGKFQGDLNISCSFCHAYIPLDMRASCCIKIGSDMRVFCKQRCYNEFKKKLRLCSFCQRDVAGVAGAFTAMVGPEGKFKEFCSQMCMKKLENEISDFEVSSTENGSLKQEVITCPVCRKQGTLKYSIKFRGKDSKLCSDLCLSSFKFANKINLDTCDNCGKMCMAEEAQAHFLQFEGQTKRFCSDNCASGFRKANSIVVQCGWCGTKKVNFDAIERQDADGLQTFCSINCLSLHRVNLQGKSGQIVPCDQCRKLEPAQYHLTMSDASVRNFCSYSCVMTFQSHFATKHPSPGSVSTTAPTPSPQLPPQPPGPQNQQPRPQRQSAIRGRMNTRQATARQQSSSIPVISNVMSLAGHEGDKLHQTQANSQSSQPVHPPTPVPSHQKATASTTTTAAATTTTETAATTTSNLVPSADGKHQILIEAPQPKVGKNKSLQCRPQTQTKATSCKPHTQTKETQTEEVLPKSVMVPIPVPIYIPMPTVMFTAPAPKLIPVPIPIPVPVFIPTTRKSTNGISKAIQEILERMPSDPLEAELLMMAEAVAADRRPGDSDTDSEADAGGEDFGVPVEDEVARPIPAAREDEALMLRKRDGQGEEDMIQMALRMAEEMSGPIEDLESSVEPVAVNTEAPPNQPQHPSVPSFERHDDYISPRSAQNKAVKRGRGGRTPTSRAKKMRIDRPYHEEDTVHSESSMQIQSMEPPPDANYRLKFTYGVNAWRHWVVSKNAQIEKTKQATGSHRLRPFTTDILKCTADELNYSLCIFIKEVRKPNGDEYSPDSIYYLCLGIQQYLYENGRIDNIFTDVYFEKFTDSLNNLLKTLRPKINSQGQMLCRIEEEHLWESKQLGAHSPFILLNTLIYFHTKHFILKTAQEHMSLSFAQILKHWKKGVPVKGQSGANKNVSLRFYCLANGKRDGLARKNKDGVPVYEVTENFDNPLRCPVKLYEFFLSKCPESIKNRNDIFYPVPERSCVPDSPVWYSTQSIDIHTMDKMLTRVLLVREIQEAHLHAQPVYL